MITRIGVVGIFVLNLDEAKSFFIDKLGFEERFDIAMGEGFRWLTVGPPGDPRFQLNLSVPGPPAQDAETATQLRGLLAKGVLSGGAWLTDDCWATYREYSARGVEFLQEPQERPYGIEAVFRDNSGNWFSLNQDTFTSFDSADMTRRFDG